MSYTGFANTSGSVGSACYFVLVFVFRFSLLEVFFRTQIWYPVVSISHRSIHLSTIFQFTNAICDLSLERITQELESHLGKAPQNMDEPIIKRGLRNSSITS